MRIGVIDSISSFFLFLMCTFHVSILCHTCRFFLFHITFQNRRERNILRHHSNFKYIQFFFGFVWIFINIGKIEKRKEKNEILILKNLLFINLVCICVFCCGVGFWCFNVVLVFFFLKYYRIEVRVFLTSRIFFALLLNFYQI